MNFDKFASEIETYFKEYYSNVAKAQQSGEINTDGGTLHYPSLLRISNTEEHYIVELLGQSPTHVKLKTARRRKAIDSFSYFDSFASKIPERPFFDLRNASGFSMRNVCIGLHTDIKAAEKRFPSASMYECTNHVGDCDGLVRFGDNCEYCWFNNCTFINRLDNTYRLKHILFAAVVIKRISKKRLVNVFQKILNDRSLPGLFNIIDSRQSDILFIAQLQNLYLSPNAHETTIGSYLEAHDDLTCKALNTQRAVYEKTLEWQECMPNEQELPKPINPDIFVRREDGYYDIFDLKTAALTKKKITAGERERRRFIAYVQDGIAQLANYEEYFKYPKNRAYAMKKHSIDVKNPRLVLIVGSWENCDLQKVKQALRSSPNVDIIDYDTFCHLFLSASNSPESGLGSK